MYTHSHATHWFTAITLLPCMPQVVIMAGGEATSGAACPCEWLSGALPISQWTQCFGHSAHSFWTHANHICKHSVSMRTHSIRLISLELSVRAVTARMGADAHACGSVGQVVCDSVYMVDMRCAQVHWEYTYLHFKILHLHLLITIITFTFCIN